MTPSPTGAQEQRLREGVLVLVDAAIAEAATPHSKVKVLRGLRERIEMLYRRQAPQPAQEPVSKIAFFDERYEFVHHIDGCPSIGGRGDDDCRCGAVEFLKSITALNQEPPPKEPGARLDEMALETIRRAFVAGWDAERNDRGTSTNPLIDAWERYRAALARVQPSPEKKL